MCLISVLWAQLVFAATGSVKVYWYVLRYICAALSLAYALNLLGASLIFGLSFACLRCFIVLTSIGAALITRKQNGQKGQKIFEKDWYRPWGEPGYYYWAVNAVFGAGNCVGCGAKVAHNGDISYVDWIGVLY